MSWASRRKGLYIGTTSVILLLILGGVGYALFFHTPTCFDGKQNGKETGVDCGGACQRICREETQMPVVLWARSFQLAPGVYTAAAYLQNNNSKAFVRQARYTFKLFDSKNDLISERSGVMAIPPGRITPVVEANLSTGNRIPTRTFFEFNTSPLDWERAEAPRVNISKQTFDAEGRRVSVVVGNASPQDITNLPVAVVLFDATDTAVAASKSVISRLPKNGDETVVFTWPAPFVGIPIRAEVTALTTPR